MPSQSSVPLGRPGDIVFTALGFKGSPVAHWESFASNLLSYLQLSSLPLTVTASSSTSEVSSQGLVTEAVGSAATSAMVPLWGTGAAETGQTSTLYVLPSTSSGSPFVSFDAQTTTLALSVPVIFRRSLRLRTLLASSFSFSSFLPSSAVLLWQPSGLVVPVYSPPFSLPYVNFGFPTPFSVLQGRGGGTSQTQFAVDQLLVGGPGYVTSIAGGLQGDVLVSSGSSSSPVWKSPISSVNVVTFASAGNQTYTPSAGMRYCLVECVGGGGAGGSIIFGGNSFVATGASGGGAGEYCSALFSASSFSRSIPVVVGGGGVPSSSEPSNLNGGAGGRSSFGSVSSGGFFLQSGGGSGGSGAYIPNIPFNYGGKNPGYYTNASPLNGGAGGSGGAAGGNQGSFTEVAGGSGGMGLGISVNLGDSSPPGAHTATGGCGGNSIFGGGAVAGEIDAYYASQANGNAASGPGGGGGGAIMVDNLTNPLTPQTAVGGSGFQGLIRIVEFIA